MWLMIVQMFGHILSYSKWMNDGKPTAVAGCPPDGFSATGQLMGKSLIQSGIIISRLIMIGG